MRVSNYSASSAYWYVSCVFVSAVSPFVLAYIAYICRSEFRARNPFPSVKKQQDIQCGCGIVII